MPEESKQPDAATGAYTKPTNETLDRPGESLGSRIGPYKLLQEIGEGGMGTVFMAEQLEPVRRMVALKVIKPGMDSKEVLARFEAERQALALMDHPNIAKVLDAGTTDTGRPYFGMELVKGVRITKYCDELQLSLHERLKLFVPVCQAIQHAHQKGVIHRDIKPSNVLVASYDGKPVPKVIDFGVAKAMGQKLTERTMFTAFGLMIGTLEYMSPEQAELNALDIDTRSDIYSLGVLLYELLTGTTPLLRKRLTQAALQDALRLIREEDPPRPSTRLSNSESLPVLSAQRKMEPAKLTKMMRGELDWIVMKALDKDRSRRYETANGFARDIERFLHDEPVEACPPSASYRLRKMASKYKAPLRVAGALFIMLIAGVIVSALLAIRAVRAENEALANAALAKANELRALEQQKEARTVLEFFLNNVLAAARPEGQVGGLGVDVSIRAALDAVEPRIAKTFQDKPLIEASIRHTLGMTYFYLGDYQLAIQQHRRVLNLRQANLDPDHPDVLTTMDKLSWAYRNAGQPEVALPLLKDVVRLRQAKLGLDHPDTLIGMDALAWGYRSLGRMDDATAVREEMYRLSKAKLGADDPATLQSLHGLGMDYRDVGRLDEAVALLQEALELRKAKFGPNHFYTLASMQNLANTYLVAGRLDDAVSLFEQTMVLRKANLGSGHPDTLMSMEHLAKAYRVAGQRQKGLELHEETLTLSKAKLGSDHPQTLVCMNNLAVAYHDAGRLNDAILLFEETLKMRQVKIGQHHPETLGTMNYLARAYREAGRLAEALPVYKETFKLRKDKLGPDDVQTLTTMNGLGDTLVRMKKYAEAEPILRECLALREQKQPDDWNTFHTKSRLGASILGQKKFADAELLLLNGYDGMKQREAKLGAEGKPLLVMALERLVQLYEETDRPDEAAKWRKELETAKQKDKQTKK